MSLVLAIDPGTTKSAYVIVDAALRPVEFQKISNCELLSRIDGANDSSTRWSELGACAIEMPAAAGYAGAELFTTCRWVGRYQQAWLQSVSLVEAELVYRKDVKMHLLGRVSSVGRTIDSAIRAALIAKHGGPSCTKRGGELYGVARDVWQALAVAHTFLESPRGTPPGQADAALKQNRIIWNTGTEHFDESPQQAKTRRAKEIP